MAVIQYKSPPSRSNRVHDSSEGGLELKSNDDGWRGIESGVEWWAASGGTLAPYST